MAERVATPAQPAKPSAKVRVVFDDGKAVALVRAPSEAQAIRHYLRTRFEAPIADQDHLLQYASKFVVEDSQAEPGAV